MFAMAHVAGWIGWRVKLVGKGEGIYGSCDSFLGEEGN